MFLGTGPFGQWLSFKWTEENLAFSDSVWSRHFSGIEVCTFRCGGKRFCFGGADIHLGIMHVTFLPWIGIWEGACAPSQR